MTYYVKCYCPCCNTGREPIAFAELEAALCHILNREEYPQAIHKPDPSNGLILGGMLCVNRAFVDNSSRPPSGAILVETVE